MVDRLYPGVFLSELAFRATPIDGVPTSALASALHATDRHAPAHVPDWTDQAPDDPGITLAQVFAFLGESLQYRTSHAAHVAARGVVSGLAVCGDGARSSDALQVSAGLALAPDGQPVERTASSDAPRVKKP
jgi:hypothetical protein